ncbi:MAG: GAF domain-containing protein [Cyanobacteriota bacterium]|nr:GAF domain-containing protein [Cyanobacteriota bacterium]
MTALYQSDSQPLTQTSPTESPVEMRDWLAALEAIRSELNRSRTLEDPELRERFHHLDLQTQRLQHQVSGVMQTAGAELFRAEREQLARLVNPMRQAPDISSLLNTCVGLIRDQLGAERVLIFRFGNERQGSVVAEAMEQGWTPALGESLPITTFGLDVSSEFLRFPLLKMDDVSQAGLTPYQRQLLDRFQVKAQLVLVIRVAGDPWGLLVVQRCLKPILWSEADLSLLSQVVTELTLLLQPLESQAESEAKILWERNLSDLLGKMLDQIRQTASIEQVFKSITGDLRSLLKTDRVAIYRFNPNWSGQFVAESVAAGWVKLVGQDVNDTYFTETQGSTYRQGQSLVVHDLAQSGHSACHRELIEQFQAKAYVVVPILQGDTLWGLLAAYQNAHPRQWQVAEISLLQRVGSQLGVAVDLAASLKEAQRQAEREQTLTKIVDRIRQSLDPDPIFKSTTQEVRQLLTCDRVALYQFKEDWSGEFVAESVAGGWVKLLGSQVKDSFLERTQGGRYVHNEYQAVDDIYATGFDACHLQLLEQFQARAYVIVPVLQGDKLWGLLAAYQNSTTRHWEESEINLLMQIGSQFGLALQQAEYLNQLRLQSEQLAEAAAREKAAKEQLQQRAIQLLVAVRPVFNGDLTVRAPITEDEVGTIADAYNNTIQSLRKLVVQVQTAASQVADTILAGESAMTGLSAQARQQLEELTQAQNEMQAAVTSTQAVVSNATQVEVAVQQANQTLQAGDRAMNRTVDGILAIRDTVSETSKKIKRLSESSQKISKVVSLIGNFATQTNLLALNAAIEATRAGEYGRGFAVVADEVRSLARQSAAATAEIEKLVQEIQMETSEVTAAMETGIQQVVEGTSLVNETRQSLNDIVASTAQISQLVQQITHVTARQEQQAQVVTDTMTDVASIASKTSADSDQIAQSFSHLLKMAEALQASVGQFKVE